MHWTQVIYLGLLLICSGAAISRDRWLLVVIMWMNFSGTFALSDVPFAVGTLDISCAAALIAFGSYRERIIAALFVPMVLLYVFEEQLGRAMLYGIIDIIAYTQMSIMGAGGFGSTARSIRDALFGMRRPADSLPLGGGRDSLGRSSGDMGGAKERRVSE